MDKLTPAQKRTSFPHVCVRIRVNQILQTKIPIKAGKIVTLEYEYEQIPASCVYYNHFGHDTRPKRPRIDRVEQPACIPNQNGKTGVIFPLVSNQNGAYMDGATGLG